MPETLEAIFFPKRGYQKADQIVMHLYRASHGIMGRIFDIQNLAHTLAGLTRDLMGYSRTLPADGEGGGCCSPLLSAKLLDRFSRRKRHWISPGLNFPNILQSLNVTDDITGRVKGQIFDYLSKLASPGKAAITQLK